MGKVVAVILAGITISLCISSNYFLLVRKEEWAKSHLKLIPFSFIGMVIAGVIG